MDPSKPDTPLATRSNAFPLHEVDVIYQFVQRCSTTMKERMLSIPGFRVYRIFNVDKKISSLGRWAQPQPHCLPQLRFPDLEPPSSLFTQCNAARQPQRPLPASAFDIATDEIASVNPPSPYLEPGVALDEYLATHHRAALTRDALANSVKPAYRLGGHTDPKEACSSSLQLSEFPLFPSLITTCFHVTGIHNLWVSLHGMIRLGARLLDENFPDACGKCRISKPVLAGSLSTRIHPLGNLSLLLSNPGSRSLLSM